LTSNRTCSSVGLLETRSGTGSTELLGFTSSGVSDEKSLVVLEKEVLQLSLGLLVLVLLVESDNALGDGKTDSLHLGAGTTSTNANADVEVLEDVSSEQENGLVNLHAEGRGLEKLEGLSIDSNKALSRDNGGNSSGILLSAESLYDFSLLLFLFTHLFLRYLLLRQSTSQTIINN